ncbi:MAG: pilus assembly protein PilM [Planctomycetota bacterium]|jgi:type IV pilus assembly protein PilM
MFPIGERSSLCIDWDEGSLRVVDASLSRSEVRIHRAVHVRLPQGTNVRDPASMGDFIRRTLGEHRIRTRKVIVDIPRQDVVLNLVSLPESSIDELASMVHIQMAKDLPFGKDEAVIDFALTDQSGSATRKLWVAAVRNMVLDHYKRVIAAAGLKLVRIGLRPFANQMAVVSSQTATGRIMIVDIGPAMSEINVIRDGSLVYSRAASVSIAPQGLDKKTGGVVKPPVSAGGDDDIGIPLEDDNVVRPGPLEVLLIEVSRTIQAYRATDPAAHLDRIVLAGSAGIDRKVCDAFEDRFNTLTQMYEVPQSFKGLRAKEGATEAFCSVIGLALSSEHDDTHRFDFLNPKEPEAQRRERAKRMPMKAVTVALFVATACVLAYNPIRKQNAEIELLNIEIKQLNEDEEVRTELMKQLGDVRSWRASNVAWLDPLKQLADVFPPNKEAYITRLDINQKGAMDIELVAVNNMVGTEVRQAVSEIKDKKGKEIFTAAPGDPKEIKGDPLYKYSDKVYVQIKSLVPEKKTKKRKR